MAEVFGHDVGTVPDNFYPTGVVVIVRGVCTDDMSPAICMRRSEAVPAWEIVGMAYALNAEATAAVDNMYTEHGGDDQYSEGG